MTVGETLIEARTQAGLSVDELSERTRIRSTVIRSIEQDDFEPLGGDLYVRGYVRAIAGAVGIDAQPLIREFEAGRSGRANERANGSTGKHALGYPVPATSFDVVTVTSLDLTATALDMVPASEVLDPPVFGRDFRDVPFAPLAATAAPAGLLPGTEDTRYDIPVIREEILGAEPGDLAAEDPAAESSAEELLVEASLVQEPVAEEHLAAEPVTEEPVVEELVAAEPVVEERAAEEPAAEEPVAEDVAAEDAAITGIRYDFSVWRESLLLVLREGLLRAEPEDVAAEDAAVMGIRYDFSVWRESLLLVLREGLLRAEPEETAAEPPVSDDLAGEDAAGEDVASEDAEPEDSAADDAVAGGWAFTETRFDLQALDDEVIQPWSGSPATSDATVWDLTPLDAAVTEDEESAELALASQDAAPAEAADATTTDAVSAVPADTAGAQTQIMPAAAADPVPAVWTAAGLNGVGSGGQETGTAAAAEADRKRRRGLISVAALAIVIAAAGLVIHFTTRGTAPAAQAAAVSTSSATTSGSAATPQSAALTTGAGTPSATTGHSPSATPKGSPNSPSVYSLSVASATAFGPDGVADGDNPQNALFALAAVPARPWETQWYATAEFGTLKTGTGLLLDLGSDAAVSAVQFDLAPQPGAVVELRAGEGAVPEDFTTVASGSAIAGSTTFTLPHPVTSRYLLIWFTQLPSNGQGHFMESVSDVSVVGRR